MKNTFMIYAYCCIVFISSTNLKSKYIDLTDFPETVFFEEYNPIERNDSVIINEAEKEELKKKMNKSDIQALTEHLSSYVSLLKSISQEKEKANTVNLKKKKMSISYSWPFDIDKNESSNIKEGDINTKKENSDIIETETIKIKPFKHKMKKKVFRKKADDDNSKHLAFERIITIGFSLLIISFIMFILIGLIIMIYINIKK